MLIGQHEAGMASVSKRPNAARQETKDMDENAHPVGKMAPEMAPELETFYARRRQADELSQEPSHNSFFYKGKWHRCACPECSQKQADVVSPEAVPKPL